MGNIYLNLVLRTQAIDYKEKHMQWAASSSEDVSASSGSEGEMDGGGHRGANPCGGVILANTQVFKACIPPYRYSECVWRFE